MPISITAVYNGSTDAPGVDLELTGLSGFNSILVERIDSTGIYPVTPVRGLNRLPVTSDQMFVTDFEAPIGIPLTYRATAYDLSESIQALVPRTPMDGTSSINYNGITAGSEDTTLLAVAIKPYTATVATPTGWTLVANHQSGTTASGEDTGSTRTYVFRKDGAITSSEVFTLTGTGTNVMAARAMTMTKTTSADWDITFSTGQDDTLGTTYSASSSSMSVSVGDVLVAFSGLTNSTAGAISTSESLVMTNTALTEQQSSFFGTALGDDIELAIFASGVTATGTSGVATYSLTSSLQTAGGTVFVNVSVVGQDTETDESSLVTIPYTQTGQAWLKSVFTQDLSREVHVEEWPEVEYETQILSKYNVLDRIMPVIITDAWGARTGQFILITGRGDLGAFNDMKTLIVTGGTLMFQTTGDLAAEHPDMYFEVTSYKVRRMDVWGAHSSPLYRHIIGFDEVDQPDTSDEGLGLRSYQDVLDENATYQTVLDNYGTYFDLLTG